MTSITQFTPAPNYIVVEPIEEENVFALPKDADDAMSRVGKIISVGEDSTNPFGQPLTPKVAVGDIILFRYQFNNDEVEINFKKYPVIPFESVRGIFSQEENATTENG